MFVLCEVETYFVPELDRSRNRVTKPLQVFKTEDEANAAWEIFNPFYDYNLCVVAADALDEEFR